MSTTTTCPPLPDYLTLRKENLEKINKYYSELLNDYSGLGGNNMDAAQNMLSSYHNQLNTAAQELISNLNKTIDLVIEQYNTLQENNDLVVKNRQRLSQLKKDIKNLENETTARRKNALETQDNTHFTSMWHTGFLIGNLLLIVINISVLVWLFMKQ